MDAVGSDPQVIDEPTPAVLAVGDNRIDPLVEATLSGAASSRAFPGKHVMSGEDEGPAARQ